MTSPVDEALEPPRAPEPGPVDDKAPPPAIDDLCPYLLAAGGGWRSAAPHRDHRCTAVEPPAPLPTDTQRRLCLSAEHASCAAFRAARAARASTLAPGLDPAVVASADAARRPIARTTAVVLEQSRLVAGRSLLPGDWSASQAAVVALMIVAFVVVLFARLSTPGSPAVSSSPSPSIAASPSPSPTPTPRPTPTLPPPPSGSGALESGSPPAASVAPSQAAVTSAPPFRTTYRVKAGDTLVGIASQFGTTVPAIQQLNGLTSSSLRIGQVLKIP